MSKSRRDWVAVVCAVMLAIAVTGCTTPSENTTVDPTTVGVAPTTAPESTDAPEPTEAPQATEAPEPTEEPEPTEAPEPTAESDTPDEETIATGIAVYQSNGCIGCHTLAAAGGEGTVGPTHDGLGATAAERIADPAYEGSATTVEEYIRESILEPSAYTVPGFPENIMPAFTNIGGNNLDALVEMLAAQ